MQDNHDVWNNSMDLAGIQNGGIVGFKYFGFGGLDKDTKGVKAFEGTKAGDKTTIGLNLTHGGKGAFKIHIKLDNPWKGQEIGVIDVPADAERKATTYYAAVPAVDGLTGKHAIYLVTDGPEVQQPQQPQRGQFGGRRPQEPQRPQGLFDLHGLSFSKGANHKAPVVPQVTITADGQRLNIPTTPVRFNAQNGFAEQNRYQVYGRLLKGSKLEATADVPGVKFEVSPIVEGRATIKATYQGQTKFFLIN
jgi:hypothetical protein